MRQVMGPGLQHICKVLGILVGRVPSRGVPSLDGLILTAAFQAGVIPDQPVSSAYGGTVSARFLSGLLRCGLTVDKPSPRSSEHNNC